MQIKPKPKLWEATKENGMTQKDLAARVGHHFSRVSRVVCGRENLDEREQARYADALGKTVEELFTN